MNNATTIVSSVHVGPSSYGSGSRESPPRKRSTSTSNNGSGSSPHSASRLNVTPSSPSKYHKRKSSVLLHGWLSRLVLSPLHAGILLTCFGIISHWYSFRSVDPIQIKWAKTSRDHILKTSTVKHLGKTMAKATSAGPNKKHQSIGTKEYAPGSTTTTAAAAAAILVDKKEQQQLDGAPELGREHADVPQQHAAGGVSQSNPSPLLKQTKQELSERHLRFPSVQERVKVYMSNWYTPPCPGNDQALVHYQYLLTATTASPLIFRELPHTHPEPAGEDLGKVRGYKIGYEFEMARMIHLHRPLIEHPNCLQNDYCVDTREYYLPALDRQAPPPTTHLPIPTLTQWGDSDTPKAYTPDHEIGEFPQVPYIMKFRFRFKGDDVATTIPSMTTSPCVAGERTMYPTVAVPTAAHNMSYFQPIVWRLTSLRHYGMMDKIPEADIPWHMKKNVAIWRGGLTGIYRGGFKLGMLKSKTPTQICLLMHRCRLVYNNHKSPLVDALMIGQEKFVPREVDGVPLYGDKVGYGDMLQYKAIIMLEGNDISSGLKWALYSNSVVMTQIPTKTSWALEELLEPWVHFVPLNDDLTDVEEQMQWVLDHDQEAQEIARRGSLWVQDLLYHPDAAHDEELIYDEMLWRYRAHFVEDLDLVHTLQSNHGPQEVHVETSE
jgi:hypothetical protein